MCQEGVWLPARAYADCEARHNPTGITTGILPPRELMPACRTDYRHPARALPDKLEVAPSIDALIARRRRMTS